MLKIKKNKILTFIIILAILIFVSILIQNKRLSKDEGTVLQNQSLISNQNIGKQEQEKQATLEINDEKYNSQIENQTSIENFMNKLRKEEKIDFKDKNYTGMGKFIEEINGVKNSGEKNWIYYVNGKKANIGISNYKINIGDIVSWKYEKGY